MSEVWTQGKTSVDANGLYTAGIDITKDKNVHSAERITQYGAIEFHGFSRGEAEKRRNLVMADMRSHRFTMVI